MVFVMERDDHNFHTYCLSRKCILVLRLPQSCVLVCLRKYGTVLVHAASLNVLTERLMYAVVHVREGLYMLAKHT